MTKRSVARSLARACASVLALLVLVNGVATADPPGRTTPCQATSPAVSEAKAALERNPELLGPRLKLADVLVDAGCYTDATSVLEAGQELHPHSHELDGKLRDVRSMVSEQRYFEGLDQAQENAKLQRNLLRCTQLADLNACDGALQLKPDDVTIWIAKGDVLLKANRPADAMTVYRHASSLNPADESIKAKLGGAQTQRQALLARCETGTGAPALEACDAALLRGADDEFNIDRRKGMLLQSANQPERALDSYIAANALKQDNESVALAIVALTESTGRKDAVALQARGTAMMTLGHPTDAVATLTQAQALAPTLPGIKSQLEAARGLAQSQPQRPQADSASIAALNAKPTKARNTASVQNTTPATQQIQVASIPSVETRTYSNDAPAAQSN
jgi:tetratricopeptide (TPR) repeat protein